MKQFNFVILLLIFVCVAITSCVKEKSFPPQPAIFFKQFVLYNKDSADCIITFKDGDGDIGILSGDIQSEDDLKMKYLYRI